MKKKVLRVKTLGYAMVRWLQLHFIDRGSLRG